MSRPAERIFILDFCRERNADASISKIIVQLLVPSLLLRVSSIFIEYEPFASYSAFSFDPPGAKHSSFQTLRRPTFPRCRYEYLISNNTNLLSRSRFFLYSSFSTNSYNFKLLSSCIFSCFCPIYALLDPFKWSIDYLWIFKLQITGFRWCTLLKPLEIARPGTRVIKGHYPILAGRVKSRIVLVRGTRGANVRTTCVGGSVLLSFTLAKSQSRLTPTCAASERPSSP